MSSTFEDIPAPVIDYIRYAFAVANNKVSATLSQQPAIHEESLDHILIAELTASPPTFFAKERIALAIETHWLGGRRMYGRWEIADIALFIILRRQGHLLRRKVALLQTKRLYSKEIDVHELDDFDFGIGIGRIADKTDRILPLSHQRSFKFDQMCVYGAMQVGSPQIRRINAYIKERDIPVYYAFYNPIEIPYSDKYPVLSGASKMGSNNFGCRVLSAKAAHSSLSKLPSGSTPRFSELVQKRPVDPFDQDSVHGWRLEKFVADEVMRCREGKIFEDQQDPNLRSLLYERSAPIAAAISITVDFAAE